MGNMLNPALMVPNQDLVINWLVQGTSEWLDWRMQGIGASEVAVIMGLSPYKTRHQLWLEKKGLKAPDDLSRNPHVRRGNYYEPIVRRAFSAHMGFDLEVFCAESRLYPWRKVSFDGVRTTSGIPVEIKCPCPSQYKELESSKRDSEAFKLYEPQLSYQIAMTGAEYGYLVFYEVNTKQMMYFKVEACQERREEIFQAVDEFFEKHIKGGIEPELDPERDVYIPTELETEEWKEYSVRLFDLQRQEKELKAELDKIKQEKEKISSSLFKKVQPFKSLKISQLLVTKVLRKGSFNYQAFLKDKGITISDSDLEKYSKEGSIHHRVTLPKEETVEDYRTSLVSKKVQKLRQRASHLFF